MIGEYMAVEEDTEDDEDEDETGEILNDNDYRDDDEAIDFDFTAAPNRTGGRKGARRWVGGFVKGLRRFPGLRKSPRRPPPDVAFSPGVRHENEEQFPTISDLQLRPLTPSLITQAVEYVEMPKPQVQQSPSPQRYLHPHSLTRKPPPAAPPSPVYSPAVEAVPQLLSTVSEHSNEQTGTQETHPRRHSNAHTHSSHTHTRPHSHTSHHSPSHSRSHSSQSTAHPVIPNNNNAQPAQPAPSPWVPSAPTVTDYITVPVPSRTPPPSKGLKRFLHNVEQLPWVESEQIVDSYYPGRSSRHRRRPGSDLEGWKPASSWYNRRHDSLPSATLLYGWPPKIQKRSSQPEVQFPHGYTPVQPVFLYPSAFPPPGVVDAPR